MRQLKGLIRMVKGGEAEWLFDCSPGPRESEKQKSGKQRKTMAQSEEEESYRGWEKEGSGRSEGEREVEPRYLSVST